jgi:hypothetical protein
MRDGINARMPVEQDFRDIHERIDHYLLEVSLKAFPTFI